MCALILGEDKLPDIDPEALEVSGNVADVLNRFDSLAEKRIVSPFKRVYLEKAEYAYNKGYAYNRGKADDQFVPNFQIPVTIHRSSLVYRSCGAEIAKMAATQ
jgi:hypothetical protein